jgi:hypothetical protein
MDSLQQELAKLESKTSGGAIQASIASIDATIEALQRWRDMVADQGGSGKGRFLQHCADRWMLQMT